MPLTRRVYQQGNSLVISLPLWMLEIIGVKKGDTVTLLVDQNNGITIRPPRYCSKTVPLINKATDG